MIDFFVCMCFINKRKEPAKKLIEKIIKGLIQHGLFFPVTFFGSDFWEEIKEEYSTSTVISRKA